MRKINHLLLGIFVLSPCIMLAQQQKLRQYKPLKKILPHAYLFSENKKYGIVDSKGKLIVEAKYDSIHPFYHNRAAVDSANFQGVIDEVGREIIAPKYYSDIWGFEDSTYSVVFLNFETGFGYIDRDGKKVFPYILNRANYFQGGLAWVGSSKFKKGPLEEYYTGYYYNPNKNRTNFLGILHDAVYSFRKKKEESEQKEVI
ncbi:MAG: WG repeat-containing protein [Cytophagia bacterium]|nr:MAG: WG repeat-containing protein [Cytophagia bacterium]